MSSKIKKLLTFSFCFIYFSTIYAQTFTDKGVEFGFTFDALDAVYSHGVSFYDFNHDGWDDLTFGQGNQKPKFFLNNEGVFEEILLNVGIIQEAKSISWVDIDNDGDSDLYVGSRYEGNFLYRNNGDLELEDISSTSGFFQSDDHEVFGACWGDYNGDNLLDVYICNYNWDSDFAEVENYLYKNLGDGTFEDVTESAGVGNGIQQTFMAVWVDYNRDGLLDISIINDRINYPNAYYENNGDGTFTDISAALGLDISIDAMSNSWADYDNDGLLDLYISNSQFNGGNRTFKNVGANFINFSSVCGTQVIDDCWGANWMDVDNDMDQDLYVSVGNYFPGDPSPNHFFFNEGDSEFTSAQEEFPSDDKVVYVCASGDYNNDGFVDMATMMNYTGYSSFWHNEQLTDNNWMKVSLEGVISNTDGTSSWIEVWCGDVKQTRFTFNGEDFMSQDSPREIIGLGTNTIVDSVHISWQSGWVDTFYNLDINQTYHIVEGSSFTPQIMASSINNCIGDLVVLSVNNEFTDILWNTEETESSIQIENIQESTAYSVTATNSFGFTNSSELEIIVNANPEIEENVVQNLCFGDSIGSISLSNISGTGYLINVWDGGETGTDLSELPAGEYSYQYVDGLGCNAIGTIEIIDPEELILQSDSIQHVSCFEACDGNLVLLPSGGVPEYSIGGEITELCSGPHSYNLMDANGCLTSLEVIIEEPLELEATILTINPEEGDNGSAEISVTGGTEPYDIDWNEVDNEDLPIGEYSAVITDFNGCITTVDFEIFVGITEYTLDDVTLYPNPVDHILNITWTSSESLMYEIYTYNGTLLDSGRVENQKISFDKFASSLYIVRIFTDLNEKHYKVSKN